MIQTKLGLAHGPYVYYGCLVTVKECKHLISHPVPISNKVK